MKYEIERKFILGKIPKNLNCVSKELIRQGYLVVLDDGLEIRIRQKGKKYFQTIKIGSGLKRHEIEIEIEKFQFQKLWSVTKGKRIEKIRYVTKLNKNKVEIDVYKGNLSGLLVAEVEFKSVNESKRFVPPRWFGRELTGELIFYNKHLAS